MASACGLGSRGVALPRGVQVGVGIGDRSMSVKANDAPFRSTSLMRSPKLLLSSGRMVLRCRPTGGNAGGETMGGAGGCIAAGAMLACQAAACNANHCGGG
eukprot:CAMPEP_0172923268 /NCGR_PEP_ID=MMETSP1075-20121228/209399_1 /TAXON_ID=2916 /ORGANISM="Ceratium fusus, Strain PA161109" /LENGTH=100 /DNA_ID=CAMNT_0013783715 /DNA_START=284 /DNA_END=583 /DNA_ORIENTATION=+